MRIKIAPVIDSTNTQLLVADGADDPQALLAEMPTAGRGRRGRSWISPFGAHPYLSIAWSWPAWPPQPRPLSLAVGVPVAAVIDNHAVPHVLLNWPTHPT